MLCYMERYAYRLAVHSTKHNLDIHFAVFYIFAKHPHLAQAVQLVHNGALYIILHFKALYYNLSVRCTISSSSNVF